MEEHALLLDDIRRVLLTRDRLLAGDEAVAGSAHSVDVEQTLREQTTGHGPLECASPAIFEGRFYVRLNRGRACYDLRAAAAQK